LSNFNDRITAENSIARTTHGAYCSVPCVESSHGTFMRRLSVSDSPETVSPSSDESLASARRRARPNTGSLRAKRVHQHLPAAARPGKARDGQFG
jgi:hypothetical protein